MLQALRWNSLARFLSRGITALRSHLPARRAAAGVQADDDVMLPPEDVLEAIENAVAHLPESERADARLDLLNILAKNYDAARLPYPRWLPRLLDQSRRCERLKP